MTAFLLRLLLAVVVAILTAAYYHIIFPAEISYFIGAAFGVLELLSPLLISRYSAASGAARAFGAILKYGAPLVLWPGIAWVILQFLPNRPAAAALAAGLAAIAGVFAAGHGQNRDTARNFAAIISGATVLLGMAQAIPAGYFAATMACIAAAISIATIRAAILWPEKQRAYCDYGIIIALAGGAVNAALALIT